MREIKKRLFFILSIFLCVFVTAAETPVKPATASLTAVRKKKKKKTAPVAVAQPTPTPPPPVVTFDETPILNDLASRYHVDVNELRELREFKWGYAELIPALILGQDAEQDVHKILKLRGKGKSWKEIGDDYFIDENAFIKECRDVLDPLNNKIPAAIISERPPLKK
jgi:hypothetical protein